MDDRNSFQDLLLQQHQPISERYPLPSFVQGGLQLLLSVLEEVCRFFRSPAQLLHGRFDDFVPGGFASGQSRGDFVFDASWGADAVVCEGSVELD